MISSGVILNQKCIQLSKAVYDYFFFKNFLYQKQSKYAMNIGLLNKRCPFKDKKYPFTSLLDAARRCLQFLK